MPVGSPTTVLPKFMAERKETPSEIQTYLSVFPKKRRNSKNAIAQLTFLLHQ